MCLIARDRTYIVMCHGQNDYLFQWKGTNNVSLQKELSHVSWNKIVFLCPYQMV